MNSLEQLQERMAKSVMQPLTPANRMRRTRGGQSMEREACGIHQAQQPVEQLRASGDL